MHLNQDNRRNHVAGIDIAGISLSGLNWPSTSQAFINLPGSPYPFRLFRLPYFTRTWKWFMAGITPSAWIRQLPQVPASL